MPSARPEREKPASIDSGAQDMVGYAIDLSHPDGGARVTLDLAPRHMNRVGSLHGGIVTMLLDAAAGFSASRSWSETGDALLVTVSLTTNYIASANTGRVTAIGRVTGGGQTIKFADSELRDDSGRLLATAAGAFKRVRTRRGP
ncbi:MAG: PaaI family thioesterase [Jhaorihella sp.]